MKVINCKSKEVKNMIPKFTRVPRHIVEKILSFIDEKLIPPPFSGIGYNPALDGIRGIAVLLVAAGHYFPNAFPFGYVGVDIFFLLSGFLITYLIASRVRNKNFSLKEFYRNRARRLFPALIFLLTFCLIFGYFLLPNYYYKSLGLHVFTTSLYIQNFALAKEIGYFDVNAIYKPLLHLWSLSVEEQFYLLFPVFLLFVLKCSRYNWQRSSILLGITAFFLLAITFFCWKLHPEKTYFMPYSRFWELLLGGLLALLIINVRFYQIVVSKVKTSQFFLFVLSFFVAMKFLNVYDPIYLSIYLSGPFCF
jgi:peptidoglycan/LPS O-acetylase OafA/YrhL